MITVKKEMDLLTDTWAGGRDAANLYYKWGILDQVEEIIAEWVANYTEATDTTVNDILWFEGDTIAEVLGYETAENLYNIMAGIEAEEENED